MELKIVQLVSALFVVGLCSGLGESRELLEDVSYELKYDSEKTLRELKSVQKPRDVAELLAATRADSKDKIGKYNKWDYLGLLEVEPKDCLSEELERRRALCKSTDVVGLKHFCVYFVGQLEEYCANTATWRILKTFIEVKEKERVIYDALEVSMNVDEFIKTKGDEKRADEENVVAFCKHIDMRPRMDQTHLCSRFNWLLEAELTHYVPDVNRVTSYLDSFTSMSEGTFVKVTSRCKIMVERCHKPVAALI